jgi:hypothetical protein
MKWPVFKCVIVLFARVDLCQRPLAALMSVRKAVPNKYHTSKKVAANALADLREKLPRSWLDDELGHPVTISSKSLFPHPVLSAIMDVILRSGRFRLVLGRLPRRRFHDQTNG